MGKRTGTSWGQLRHENEIKLKKRKAKNGSDKIQDGEANFESIRAGKDFGCSSTLLQALSMLKFGWEE